MSPSDPFNPVQVRQVSINWIAYFRTFVQAHGGNPIPYKGRLLFRDAWSYSMTDHTGPEWPPPEDAHHANRLMLQYWIERRKVLGQTCHKLRSQLQGLQELQAKCSAPLQQSMSMWDEEKQQRVTTIGPIDYDELQREIDGFESDLAECKDQIELLQPKPVEVPDERTTVEPVVSPPIVKSNGSRLLESVVADAFEHREETTTIGPAYRPPKRKRRR